MKETIDCHWLLCPICNNKTRIKLRKDTVIEKLPLYCPKCRKEIVVSVKQLNIRIIKEPDAQTL
ncbi:cysteine-rich KTR domain-containing protein [Clostridium sp. FAM 1755]|uniref:cysteine-rich KTR domain-containing protein n=1 Tax=Clostridium caseinilyticum TaxID=3350403 RepID=UPI0038F6D2C2